MKWYRVILTKKYYDSSAEYFVVAKSDEEASCKGRALALEDGFFSSGVFGNIFTYEEGEVVI